MGDPEKYHTFRKTLETDFQSVHSITLRGSQMSTQARGYIVEQMRQRLAKKPEVADLMIPTFSPGCKRLTPGLGYLKAVAEDNVDFTMTPIKAVQSDGIDLQSGRQVKLDVLVCATGYHAVSAPIFPVQ